LHKLLKNGLSRFFNAKDCLPIYGQQDKGIAPCGVMDQLAYSDAVKLLGRQANCIEFIMPPVIEFIQDGTIALSGAIYQDVTLDNEPLNFLETYQVQVGQTLRFSKKIKGFRTYLTMLPELIDKRRDNRDYFERHPKMDPYGRVRVMYGPEFAKLANPGIFFEKGWQIGTRASAMGLGLTKWGEQLKLKNNHNMISSPVADGTVQMSPSGPIILLRDRQTIGGYPRIFNVISVDINRLAQLGPRDFIKFQML
jgi:allophanate hydrolase subunit 2